KRLLSTYQAQYILLDEHGLPISSCNTLFDTLQENYACIIAINPVLPSLIEQLQNESQCKNVTLQCVHFYLSTEELRYVDLTLSKIDNGLEILIEDLTNSYSWVVKYQNKKLEYAQNRLIEEAKAEVREKSKAFMIHTFEDLSHELRNPLNSLVGLAGLLSTEGQEERVNALQSTAKILVQIADNLLDISTLDNQLVLKKDEVVLKDVIADLKNTFSFQAASKNINFEVVLGGQVPQVIFIDRSRLTQVLYNLLGNALKFTLAGKISLLITGDEKNICFEVEDTGIGIDAKKLETILNRFSQGHDQIHQIYGGLGLGLSISKQIINLLGGDLGVRSVLNEGSTFFFKIPVTIVENEKEKQDHIDLLGFRVLLVDDDAMNLIVQKQQLEKLGLEVTTTNTGKDVLDLLYDKKYDLIIVDYQMPEIEGKQVIEAVRKHFKIPIILLSGYSKQSRKLQDANPDLILTKPVSSDKIIEAIAQLHLK
ncbi:MAG: ATP-binding protein, partial [Cyclobacteriaceae bacterium]